MSYPSRPRSASRASTIPKAIEPWCFLTSETHPAAGLFQVALIDPCSSDKNLQYRLAHVWGQRGLDLCLDRPSNVFHLRSDMLSAFGSGSWAILPNIELLRDILDEVKAHRSLSYSKPPNWRQVHPRAVRDYQFIPLQCLTEPISFVRRHHPHVANYVEHLPLYDTVPLLRCHVHPYPAIVNAMMKFLQFPLHELPDRYQESIELTWKICDCWMSERVPGPPLNSGHRRTAARGMPGSNPATPPFSWSPPSTPMPSQISVSHNSRTTHIRNRPKYCADTFFRRCYNKPRRDPPVLVSQMYLPHQRVLTEPETVFYSRSRVGTPCPGEAHWWPDEHLTPSCVESVSSGIVYERDNEQVLLRYDDMDSSFEGTEHSYVPLDNAVYQPQLQVLPAPARRGKNPAPEPSYIHMLNGCGNRRDVRAWARKQRRYQPVPEKADSSLRKYRSEPSRAVPSSSPWTWQPGSLSVWPKWAVKKRAEEVAKMFNDQSPLLWERASG